MGSEFACTFKLTFQNSTIKFKDAIDGYNYTKLLDIDCKTSNDSWLYRDKADPSYLAGNGFCKGFKNIPERIDCSANTDNNTRRLYRCLDAGINLVNPSMRINIIKF